MRLEEAIKILTRLYSETNIYENSTWVNAIQLGIEALKRISSNRDCANSVIDEPLPGETKD